MTATVPPPGLIGLTPVHGEVGRLIRLGQWLNGDGFATWEHAFISIGNGLIVEAEPGGARVAHADAYSVVHWCEGIYSHLVTRDKAMLLEDAAKSYVGVGYSALDYFALVAHRLHVNDPGLQRYIASTKHMICSQLVDQCYQDAGLQIFTDNRWAGYVTPGSLFARDQELTAP